MEKCWIILDYRKAKKYQMKLIDWYRLFNIDWLADIDWLDDLTLTIIRKSKTRWKDLTNRAANVADVVRFRPHTYARTKQSLSSLLGGNKLWNASYTFIYLLKIIKWFITGICYLFFFRDTENLISLISLKNIWYWSR